MMGVPEKIPQIVPLGAEGVAGRVRGEGVDELIVGEENGAG